MRRLWTGRFRRTRPLAAAEAYALWAERYPPWPHNPLMAIEQQVAAPLIASTRPARALDVGTGSGRYLPLLASTGARLVVGVDMSMPMMTHAVRSVRLPPPRDASADQVRLVCGDACRLPFGDASFDLVSSFLMVGDVPDLAAWIHEIARVVAPGGHVIYSDFHPSWATRGWRRTFQAANGRTFEISYSSHAIAEHVAVLEAQSFDVLAIHEPRPTERDPGVAPAGARGHDVPVVAVLHAVKRGPG